MQQLGRGEARRAVVWPPRQATTASTTFLRALGWAGERGAFSLRREELLPSSRSCVRPSPSRTLGNQS